MASESSFSKEWKRFVDHKWIKQSDPCLEIAMLFRTIAVEVPYPTGIASRTNLDAVSDLFPLVELNGPSELRVYIDPL